MVSETRRVSEYIRYAGHEASPEDVLMREYDRLDRRKKLRQSMLMLSREDRLLIIEESILRVPRERLERKYKVSEGTLRQRISRAKNKLMILIRQCEV